MVKILNKVIIKSTIINSQDNLDIKLLTKLN